MAKIKTSDLQTGWVLAEDVHDLSGRFLMGKDCELTDKHIRALRAWGVNSVEVEGENIPASGSTMELPDELMSEVRIEQQHRLKFNDMQDSFIKELYELSSLYIARSRQQDKP